MSTTLEQLRVERNYLLNLLKDLKKQAGLDTTSESTYTMLFNEYEAKLIRVENDISHHELHQDRQQIAPNQPATETVQLAPNPHIIKIETTHTHIPKSVKPRTKQLGVSQRS